MGDLQEGVPECDDEEHDPEAGEPHDGPQKVSPLCWVRRGHSEEAGRHDGGATLQSGRVCDQTWLPWQLRLLHSIRRSE